MGKIIAHLDDYRQLPFELPFRNAYELRNIRNLRSRFSKICGIDYLSESLELAERGKKIFSESNISDGTIPYNISVHIDKTSKFELERLLTKISNSIEKTLLLSIRKQLFHFRTGILIALKNK